MNDFLSTFGIPMDELGMQQREAEEPVTLEQIALLSIASHQATERYCAHFEDAEACGYSNDPTGSLHVSDSYNRMSELAEQLREMIEKYTSQQATLAQIAERRKGAV